ncbi:MAG TPA: non-canonical purine NTP pyrophosphatase [Patescibacteria group bacterium]
MLHYITTNQNKIDIAKKFLTPHEIFFEPQNIELTEIQSKDIKKVVENKAKQAYEIIKTPLFVNDHFWSITALNGFPGAYMKYMNEWLTPDDFLNLMKGKKNREAILTEAVCYIDESRIQTFLMQHKAVILESPKGKGLPALRVISVSGDGLSIAEKLEKDPSAVDVYPIWDEFAKWYKSLG